MDFYQRMLYSSKQALKSKRSKAFLFVLLVAKTVWGKQQFVFEQHRVGGCGFCVGLDWEDGQ